MPRFCRMAPGFSPPAGTTPSANGTWPPAKSTAKEILRHPEAVSSLAILPDGRRAITSSDDKTVRLWNLETAKVERTLQEGDDIQTVAVSPDGRLALGLSSVEGRIRIWQLDTGREWLPVDKNGRPGPYFELNSEMDSLWSATFSPDNHGLLNRGRE